MKFNNDKFRIYDKSYKFRKYHENRPNERQNWPEDNKTIMDGMVIFFGISLIDTLTIISTKHRDWETHIVINKQ